MCVSRSTKYALYNLLYMWEIPIEVIYNWTPCQVE